MTTRNAVIPEEVHTVLEFRQRDLPGFATVNAALREFEPKIAFSCIYLYFSNALTLSTVGFLLPMSKNFCTNLKMG
jgi:hypothetical protein